MNLEPNSQLGQYQIIREIGRGGMGVVYLGHDTRLDRQVAIKSLPEELASDPNRLSRFEREARTLASLSHPNVAGIFGLESIDGARYLVLEYVDGETLAERLDRGPLPVDDALEVAVRIAKGVEAAHEAGIIHRDLKPANIKVSLDNEVKVLDFGLAKASDEQSSTAGGSSTELPTVTSPVLHSPTIPGAILGTAPYMSPEQARGRHVDKRTDIWSFGLVLYEMLSGVRPFHGETATDSIGAILHKDIDLELLPAGTPPIVRHVLSRCLERDKHQRLHDIADARIELENAKAGDTDSFVSAGAEAGGSGGSRLAWALAAVFLVAAIALGALLLKPAPAVERVRLVSEFAMPEDLELRQDHGPIEFSPDGTRLAFIAQRGAKAVLCVRELSTGETRVIDGLERPTFPFWSPNGKWIACFDRAALVRVNAEGGRPELLVDNTGSINNGGGDWREDGTILFGTVRGPLMRVDERGGEAEVVLDMFPDRMGDWPVCPQYLPGGEHYIVMNQDDHTSNSGLYVCNMEGEIVKRLFSFETTGRFVAPDSVVYWRAGDLHRQRLDMTTFEFIGDSERIAEGVWRDAWPAFSAFSIAPGGLLAYVPQSNQVAESELVEFDRATDQVTPLGITGSLWGARYSPSGDRIAYDTTFDTTAGDVAVYDLARGVETMLSRDTNNESLITWSADGRSLHYFRGPDIYSVPTSGTRQPSLTLSTGTALFPFAETRDGRSLVFGDMANGNMDLHLLDLETGEHTPWLATSTTEAATRFSPDGKWVVFASSQSGERRVVLRSFPDGDIAMPVSGGPGDMPVWVGDEIFYETPEHIMSVRVTIGEDGYPVFGEPVVEVSSLDIRDFDVSPDGTTLLLNRMLGWQRGGTIRLVQNWAP